jgi:hypothetical protein
MAWSDVLQRSEAHRIPSLRVLRTTLRTLHLLAAAGLYGGHLHGVEAAQLRPALAATLVTGGAFLGLEVWRFPPCLMQLRGVATLGKLALLASVPLFWEQRALILSLVLVIGVVTSHMPGRLRYRSLLSGVPPGPEDKG